LFAGTYTGNMKKENNMTSISETRCYTLILAGPLEDEFIAACFPAETNIASQDGRTILSGIHTDQSGILGLLRQLHNLGCVILEMTIDREQE
jgi:hypothetical protein